MKKNGHNNVALSEIKMGLLGLDRGMCSTECKSTKFKLQLTNTIHGENYCQINWK